MSQERQGWGEEIKNSASASFKQEKTVFPTVQQQPKLLLLRRN